MGSTATTAPTTAAPSLPSVVGEEATSTATTTAATMVTPDEGLANQKFCGYDVDNAIGNCTRDRHCLIGDECPPDQYCFVVNCFVDEIPSYRPTFSPMPTAVPPPPEAPSSPSPTAPPLEADDICNFFWCGIDWGDASGRCHLQCVDGFHSTCPEGEECFANVRRRRRRPSPTNTPLTAGRTPSPDGSTWSPTATSSPTVAAAAGEDEGDAEQSAGGGEDGDDEESAAGRTPSPDGSTWSPTLTPPPMVIPDETIMTTTPETMLPTESLILADDYSILPY